MTILHDNEAVDKRIRAAAGEIETKRSFFADWCITNSPRSSFNLNLIAILVGLFAMYLQQVLSLVATFLLVLMFMWCITRLQGQSMSDMTQYLLNEMSIRFKKNSLANPGMVLLMLCDVMS